MAGDRRNDPRSPIHSLTPVPVVFSGRVQGTGWLYDISLRGCKIRATVTPSLGASVTLRLSLDQQGPPLVIEEAVVGWTIPSRYFGVKFIRVKPNYQEALERYIASDETMPTDKVVR